MELALSIPNLSMGGRQAVLIAVFLVIALIILGVFITIAVASEGSKTYEQVSKVGYAIRTYWFIILLALAVTQVSIAAAFTPYKTDANPDVVLKVTGYQFNWTFDAEPEPIKAGSLVRFEAATSDVTHGVGVVDPDGKMLASVQAMPGYTNKFDLRLKKPGTYLVACMEYCGIGHHKMLSNFEVKGGE